MTYIVLRKEDFVAATDDIISALELMRLYQGKVETEDGVELARIPNPRGGEYCFGEPRGISTSGKHYGCLR